MKVGGEVLPKRCVDVGGCDHRVTVTVTVNSPLIVYCPAKMRQRRGVRIPYRGAYPLPACSGIESETGDN